MNNPMQAASLPGLILLAHGSRDPQWRQPIEAVLQSVRQSSPSLLCCCAYLESCAPDLLEAAQELVAAGVTRLTVMPLFLGTGKHAREDIPRQVQALRERHPALQVVLEPSAGENPRVTALLAEVALASTEY